MSDKRQLITQPPPKGKYMHMTIVRNKSGFLNAFYPVYHMYFSENMNIHVLSAKKKSKHKNPSYVFSMSKKDFNEKKDQVLGKIVSNIWGTMFVLYSTGNHFIFLSENDHFLIKICEIMIYLSIKEFESQKTIFYKVIN